MQRFKTLHSNDPEFKSYLEGTFSDEYRALPLRSLNVDTEFEEITFDVRKVADLGVPSLTRVIWSLIRPQTLILSAGPMISILFFCLARQYELQPWIALSTFMGVLLCHVAMNLYNDYGDHIHGRDRLRPGGGSRVIQRGWLRAVTVKRAGHTIAFFAFLCGLPVILKQWPLWFVLAFVAFDGLEFAFQKLRLKTHGLSEVVAFGLTGPLLTGAFAWGVTGHVGWAEASLGCIFGAIALMYFHSSNFENIMVDSQAGVRTWATRVGFDASKQFLHFTALLTLFCTSAYIVLFERHWALALVLVAQLAMLARSFDRIRKLASPLSSELVNLRFLAVRLCWITTAAFALAYWILISFPHLSGPL